MIRFFIDRPIFASVIALVMILMGGLALATLPISQYPAIVPPTIQVSANYPGASAAVVSEVVTRPLEMQINGVEDMIYMSSNSTNNGTSQITITFDVGTDQDIAAVNVNNDTSVAISQLPVEVQQQGISIEKQSTDLLLIVSLYSPNGTWDSFFLGNYAQINVLQALQRVPGVGQVTNFGLLEYSMRIWLDVPKIASMGLTPQQIEQAVKEQNKQAVGGQSGAPPTTAEAPPYILQVNALGRLEEVEQFEQIVVASKDDGSVVLLKDVARVELGAASYDSSALQDGKAAALLGIYQLPDANAFSVAEGIRQQMEALAPDFPADLEFKISFDTTEFVTASIEELIRTFVEAAILVIVVIFVFLQRVRATLVPMIAIPVSIIAAFAVMPVVGFSINTLTLLGLVLAIGLVVDDAIVVVENVQRQFEEGETSPRRAARKAMAEVARPIVATTLVLAAVFIPAAMMPGITGQLYNQFAATIAISVIFSGINSLTLSPAMAAVLLRPGGMIERGPFGWFNKGFNALSNGYAKLVGGLSKVWVVMLLVLAGLLATTAYFVVRTPTAFIPEEDNGYFFALYQTPPGASLARTEAFADEVRKILEAQPEVATVIEVNGVNFITNVAETNAGFMVPVLKPWDQRQGKTHTAQAIIDRVAGPLFELTDGLAFGFPPPAIPGLGTVGGFQLQINDQSGLGVDALVKGSEEFMARARELPEISQVSTTFQANVPQLELEIDRIKMQTLGVTVENAFDVLQLVFGSAYVNQFNEFGQVYDVYIQGDAVGRMQPDDLLKMYVKNDRGEMIPFSAFATVGLTTGPDNLTHYNVMNSVTINGSSPAGVSSGEAIKALDALSKEVLPAGLSMQWTGIVYQQLKAGNLAPIVFGLAVILVFLFLAAQYESWTLPILVLVTVPLAALGAVLALGHFGKSLDVYAQIGLVMLIGLAAKNGILIIEFAKDARETGKTALEAAVTAARLRLRPILMTAFAFILGVVPLADATGAGANARQSIGITVIGGLALATFFTLFIVPVLYVGLDMIRVKVFKIDPTKKPGDQDVDAPEKPAEGEQAAATA
jgi:hydrophobe/amphiphile efflux-1 (HAE1) family protein